MIYIGLPTPNISLTRIHVYYIILLLSCRLIIIYNIAYVLNRVSGNKIVG